MTPFYLNFQRKSWNNYVVSLFFVLFASIGFAQKSNPNVSKALNQLVEQKSLVSSDIEYVITADHISSVSGTHHIYFNQAINGVKINGTESSIHITKTGKVLKNNTNFINNVLNEIKNGRSAGLTAQSAIQTVASKYGYRMTESLTLVEQKSTTKMIFSAAGISDVEIPVEQVYYYVPKQGVYLAWELSISEVETTDWWNFHVDALTGDIINYYNFTTYCNFEHDHSAHTFIGPMPQPKEDVAATKIAEAAVPVPSQYQVFAMPIESPLYGSRTIEVSPENTTASPHGWHDTNNATGAEFTNTRGNNVYAYDDDNNSNSPSAGSSPDGGASLDFSGTGFAFSPPYSAGTQSEAAAVTNLFYWNNIIHDVLFLYGFDSPSGNFQENTYSQGGAGSDSVNAEAQDGGGTCNANMGTPSDGARPRMQMYICGGRDGDFDNLVVVHEYAHGISNRLTGGPAAATCLTNSEQMGEGWSDYYGLMLTLQAGDTGTDARGVGTYLIGEGAGGPGIRPFRYSTDMGTNPHTYSDIASAAIPHGVGSVWAMMVWEMTWGLIDEHGFDADIYNGTGGNNIALTLVTEGMKLQPCSPGFVDGRDAILLADQNIYGGANQCIIWTAFAKRGLGLNASQGSTSSVADGTEDFTGPIPAFTVSADTFCSTEAVQTLSGGSALNPGVYSGPGVTDNGDGTFDFDPTAAGIGTHTIVFTTTDCDGAPATPSDTIDVTDGNPVIVCMDASLTLDGAGSATLSDADVIGNLTAGGGYTIDQAGTFAPTDISAVDTVLALGDDSGAPAALGFSFDFFGNTYTTVYVASNGYLTFTNAALNVFTNTAMGNGAAPNNLIAAMWDDLTPDAGSTISYATIGSAPDRVFIVNYDNIRHYTGGGTGTQNTFQVKLFEGTGVVEIHSTNVTSDGGTRTQGIENIDATESYAVTGRDNTSWTATNDFVAFIPIPDGLAENCGNTVTLSYSQTSFSCADIGDNIVTITADDGNGGISTCDVTVTITGSSSIFAGGTWDVTPNAGTAATFSENFDTASFGDVIACSCDIPTGVTVAVNAGGTLDITGNINVDGVLDIEHEGSVVQRNDDAAVNKTGSIFVRKTTPSLDNRDFMIIGNPMTGTTRANTFGSAMQFRHHLTASFVPNSVVAAFDPGVENWADDNGDNWVNYSAGMNPGEGYLILPQAAPTVPDGAIYNFVYDDGTLNNGVFNFAVGYNGSQNASANVVSNPYASAIDADQFIADNSAMVSTLFFWEHISSPSILYPGYNPGNYDMGDISMYSPGVGGAVAAANGGTAPTGFIASGQGFGFKALAAGTLEFNNGQRVAGNNDDYKSALIDKDRIWLNVLNETTQLGSQMLVGFVEGATQNFEPFYDAKRLATPVSLFSTLTTGEQLAIQGRGRFTVDAQITLGFRSQIEANELFTISLNKVDRALMGDDVHIYLEDTVTGAIVDLSERNYSFSSNASLQEDRFVLFFQEKVLGTDDYSLDSIQLVPNPTMGILNVVTPNSATVDYVQVVDIRGRLVSEKRFNNTDTYVIDMSDLGSAVYFVKVFTTEGIITKRVIKQ